MDAFLEQSVAALGARGFDKSQARLVRGVDHELQMELGEPALLRTVHQNSLQLGAIHEQRRGDLEINSLTNEALQHAVEQLWEVSRGANPDPAFDVSPAQAAGRFEHGPVEADFNAMYSRLEELMEYGAANHPTVTFRSAAITFHERNRHFLNSNAAAFEERSGHYTASLSFSAKEGTRVSSMNYTGMAMPALDRPLAECATTRALLAQIAEQIETRPVPEKFVGSLLVTPDCLPVFFGFLTQRVSDLSIISGASIYHDKLGEAVAADALSLHSRPLETPAGQRFTGDGYPTENLTLIDHGVLQSHLLSLYGANKTGGRRADSPGGSWMVDAGTENLAALIGEIEEGVMISRFSGGMPNEKGDFSGIAKNSYYIKDGNLQFPIGETMIAGNMASLLHNISAVSSDLADFGHVRLPWVRMEGISVS